MTTPWEYLVNGSLIQASYQAFNQPWSQAMNGTNSLLGILFILFQILLFFMSRNNSVGLAVGLIFFVLLYGFLDPLFKAFIVTILLLQAAGWVYSLYAQWQK